MSPKPNDSVLIRERKGHSDTEKAALRWTKAETQPRKDWATRRVDLLPEGSANTFIPDF